MAGKQWVVVATAATFLLVGGCAMTVDAQQNASFSSQGHDVNIETRVKRDAVMLLDDAGDSYEIWGVNREAYAVCLAYGPSGAYVERQWLLSAQSEQQLFRSRLVGGSWRVKPQSSADPTCSNWT